MNVYKFPLDNFHLQEPSTIIESSQMLTKSRYHKIKYNLLIYITICNIKHYVIQLLRQQKLNKMLLKLYNVLKAYILNNVLKIVQ